MSRSRYIAQAGVIAAVYGALTLITILFLQGFAWGPVQFRISEAACVLAFFTPAAIPGLTLGSVIANGYNFMTTGNPFFLLDVVFGSLATCLGAVWTWKFRGRVALGLLGPVITNALIVPAYLPTLLLGLGVTHVPVLGLSLADNWVQVYAVLAVSVALGEAAVMYLIGLPLLIALRRTGLGHRLG